MTINLLYFVSHPIQYQAPLLRLISDDPDINLKVVFEADYFETSYFDEGFGVDVKWDIPLREGYESVLLDEIDAKAEIRNADAVWFHGWQSSGFRRLQKFANKNATPVLMRGENWDGAMPDGRGLRGWFKRLYLSQIFGNCDGFLAIGTENRRYYNNHGVADDHIFSMPYAVDNSFFEELATKNSGDKFRAETGVPESQKIILYAGKMSSRKKSDTLLKAWEQANWLLDRRPALIFVGDGELITSLKSEAAKSIFTGDIYFTGFRNQTELPAIYQAADVFVLASEKEAWGLGINEAMACGTAIIASNQCGAAFDLVTEETGRVVEAGNASELAIALVEVIERTEEMGLAAKSRIANWDFNADLAGLKAALDFCQGSQS